MSAVVATVLNGIVFWARRVGLYQPGLRQEYFDRVASMDYSTDASASFLALKRFGATLYDTDGWLWWFTKFPKELVWLGLGCLLAWKLRRIRLPRTMAGAYAGLFGILGVSAVIALGGHLWVSLLAGMRSSMSWALGATGTEFVDAEMLRRLSRAFAWLLVLQGLLLPWELLDGSIMYWSQLLAFDVTLPRPVGTFNLPISLAVFTVAAWACAFAWAGYSWRTTGLLTVLTALVLLVAASAAAWVAWVLALCSILHGRLRERPRMLALLLLLPMTIGLWIALPSITGRDNIHDSLWGRVEPVVAYAGQRLDPLELALGLHFGAGSNAQAVLSGAATINAPGPLLPAGDSMPAALLWSAGLLGTLLAYLLMVLAIARDPRGRPLGIVLLVSSVALNLPELFPVNLLLGLWLARSARMDARA